MALSRQARTVFALTAPAYLWLAVTVLLPSDTTALLGPTPISFTSLAPSRSYASSCSAVACDQS